MNVRTIFKPHFNLRPKRPRNEPGDLDNKQKDTQQLKEKIVDRDRNTQKDHEAIGPGEKGKRDQETPQAGLEVLGVGLAPAEQPAPQAIACQRKTARM